MTCPGNRRDEIHTAYFAKEQISYLFWIGNFSWAVSGIIIYHVFILLLMFPAGFSGSGHEGSGSIYAVIRIHDFYETICWALLHPQCDMTSKLQSLKSDTG